MNHSPAPRQLIVNADDFGRSESINTAVARACHEGLLTSASLMVNEPAFHEAVSMARERAHWGMGLHLTLIFGHSTLPHQTIPGLVDDSGAFPTNPVAVGAKYFFRTSLREQLRNEMAAQVSKYHATGLPMDHLDGHMHLHMQPVVFRIIRENAVRWGITRIRLTCEPLFVNLKAAAGRYLVRSAHAAVFRCLSAWHQRGLARIGIRFAPNVFGQLQDGRMNEDYLLNLLPLLPPGNSELYSHPSMGEFKHEFDALVSPRVKNLVNQLNIRLIRYTEL